MDECLVRIRLSLERLQPFESSRLRRGWWRPYSNSDLVGEPAVSDSQGLIRFWGRGWSALYAIKSYHTITKAVAIAVTNSDISANCGHPMSPGVRMPRIPECVAMYRPASQAHLAVSSAAFGCGYAYCAIPPGLIPFRNRTVPRCTSQIASSDLTALLPFDACNILLFDLNALTASPPDAGQSSEERLKYTTAGSASLVNRSLATLLPRSCVC